MRTVTSRDGTKIAYEKHGSGPALIIVLGVLGGRTSASTPQLVELLAKDFTVYAYDRRGKGDSGDTQPYAVEREIEDLEAVIDAAGGEAYVYGHSSGGALALLAAAELGSKVRKLALYEVPYNEDPQGKAAWKDYISRLTRLLDDGKNGDAVALFLQYTGLSAEQVAGMRQAPFWPAMEAAGHTLAYDHAAILGPEAAIPTDRAAGVTVPALVMSGGASFPFMKATAERLSDHHAARQAPDTGRPDARCQPGSHRAGACGVLSTVMNQSRTSVSISAVSAPVILCRDRSPLPQAPAAYSGRLPVPQSRPAFLFRVQLREATRHHLPDSTSPTSSGSSTTSEINPITYPFAP